MGMREDLMEAKKELEEIKQQSFAIELLSDFKKQNRRLFIIWIITFIAFISLLGYMIYLLNDIGTINETTTSTQEVSDIDSMNNSNIVNGDYNGESKTNG